MHCALMWIVTRHRGQRYNVFSIGLNLIKRNKLLVALLMWQPALGFMSLENCSIRCLYAFVTFKLKTEAALALSLFTPAVCHSPKYDSSVTPESRTAAQKLLTAVFEVNEISEPPPRPFGLTERQRECKMVKKDAGDGTDLLIRWARGGPEDRIPSLLPRLKFCAWEVFNFLKSQLRSVGSVISPIAHRFSDCPYAWAWGGGSAFGDGGGRGGVNQ